MQNINIGVSQKQQFIIDDDESKVIELDTTDLSVVNRLHEVYSQIEELNARFQELSSESDEKIEKSIQRIKEADQKCRELIDYVFDSKVCDVISPSGTMFDPVKGTLKYERIITALMGVYEEDINKEFKKIANNIKKHTAKYTKKKDV